MADTIDRSGKVNNYDGICPPCGQEYKILLPTQELDKRMDVQLHSTDKRFNGSQGCFIIGVRSDFGHIFDISDAAVLIENEDGPT